MNYYEARKSLDGTWRWTRLTDGKVLASGACTIECTRQTKEEAENHESTRIRALIKEAPHIPIDTSKGRTCEVEGCANKAFHYVDVNNTYIQACDSHLDNPEWYNAPSTLSSW